MSTTTNGSKKSRSPSASPYSSRRTSSNPKSTRQQYSACGACRMRRVRCDLKDLPISGTGQHPPCSNCKERGLRCVDEYAEVKAVKLLRRGRRLQQVEAVYGKRSPDESTLYSISPPPSVIPTLRPEFFNTPFFRRFHVQRPVIEPTEYCPRYIDFFKGSADSFPIAAQLIAMILVIWAASFGVSEYGIEQPFDGPLDVRRNNEQVADMLHEVLYLIDVHGILRKPSWDGVRALLLLVPLTQEVQLPMERLTMYEATLSQVYTLCSVAPVSSVCSGQGEYVDVLVRARIFWYAHVIDGITSGLRGGRLLLNDDDLAAFEATLPSPPTTNDPASGRSASYTFAYRFADVPIRVSSICRKIHSALTGPRARHSNDVDEEEVRESWGALDRCWNDFEGLRHHDIHGVLQDEDVERFIDSWKIFLFECLNVIREALKQRLVPRTSQGPFTPGSSSQHDVIARLHSEAASRCHRAVVNVVAILQRNLGTAFHQYDAALVRNGCFFAAFLLAGESGRREDVETCLQALSEMRWSFSKSEEREETVRMIWSARPSQPRNISQSTPVSPIDGPGHGGLPTPDDSYPRRLLNGRAVSVPPLILPSLPTTNFDSSSEPSTACTSDGRWPSAVSPSSGSLYSRPMSSHRSSSSTSGSPPYLSNSQQLDLPSLSSTMDTSDATGPNSLYYLAPYTYIGMHGGSEVSHSSNVLTATTSSDTPFSHNPPQFFDPSSVVFSGATIVQHGTGSGGLPVSGVTGNSDDSQLRSGVFYH